MGPGGAMEFEAGTSPSPNWNRAIQAGLTFRHTCPSDLPFLFRLYASTRTKELAPLPWSDAQKAAFLDMQARAQHADYARNYPDAERWVIERNGDAVGRLYLDRRQGAHHILDIALLPDSRGRGFGGALLADLIDEAAQAGKATTISVESMNPARRLYERLGFTLVEEHPPYLLMRREGAVS